jgi:hypothetical protein
MVDMPTPKLPADTKRLEFLAFMIWVGLVGAVLILLIDYQIKGAILKASKRAWEGISAIEAEQRGTNYPTNNAGIDNSIVGDFHGTEVASTTLVEGISDPTSANGSGPFKRTTRPKPRAGTGDNVLQPPDKPVES